MATDFLKKEGDFGGKFGPKIKNSNGAGGGPKKVFGAIDLEITFFSTSQNDEQPLSKFHDMLSDRVVHI